MKFALITTALLFSGLMAHAQGEPVAAPQQGSQVQTTEKKAETKNMKHKKHDKKSEKKEEGKQ